MRGAVGTDLHLDAVLADLRARCRRRRHGRIVCTVEIEDGVVANHRCEETEMTERDLERVMREKPWRFTP